MALAPIPSLKKDEIVWLYRNKCRHGHRYLSHYQCYLDEERKELIGFFDLEATNLTANFGIVICYCLKPEYSNKILYDCITKEDLKSGILDKRVLRHAIKDLWKVNRVVGHYSTKFDLPFLRTRCLSVGVEFPQYGEILHTDVWKIAREKLKLSSNRQDVIAEALYGESVKTRLDSKHWLQALQGNPRALNYILDHCKKDVVELEANYHKLAPFVPKRKTSI